MSARDLFEPGTAVVFPPGFKAAKLVWAYNQTDLIDGAIFDQLGHASVSTTLDVYAHLFDEAGHSADIRARMAGSAFAGLLNPDDDRTVIVLPAAADPTAGGLSARERAAIRWAT